MTPLEIICVGAGRDGTNSLAILIENIYQAAGLHKHAGHEYASRRFHTGFCDWREQGDDRALETIRSELLACPLHCIVGNGYAPLLDRLPGWVGKPLRLLHVQRRDRNAWLASTLESTRLFPGVYRYYVSDAETDMKRFSAFHFDETSQAEWREWPIEQKLIWYFDKTHALSRAAYAAYDSVMHVWTEDLSDPATISIIAEFVGGYQDTTPAPVHINRHLPGMENLSVPDREKLHWFLGLIDYEAGARDTVYILERFIDQYVGWCRGRIAQANDTLYQTADRSEIERLLHEGRKTLSRALADLERLQGLLK